jgi:hypothetical protein
VLIIGLVVIIKKIKNRPNKEDEIEAYSNINKANTLNSQEQTGISEKQAQQTKQMVNNDVAKTTVQKVTSPQPKVAIQPKQAQPKPVVQNVQTRVATQPKQVAPKPIEQARPVQATKTVAQIAKQPAPMQKVAPVQTKTAAQPNRPVQSGQKLPPKPSGAGTPPPPPNRPK